MIEMACLVFIVSGVASAESCEFTEGMVAVVASSTSSSSGRRATK